MSTTTTTMVSAKKTREILRSLVPWALKKNAHNQKFRSNYKGNRGRIGVVGGARDYSGAPYFASISCMRLGADLSYVICSSSAGQVIKNYSPDLIVTPLLDCANESEFQNEMNCLMTRLHALVIGPGLGRDKLLLNRAKTLIEKAKLRHLPLIFDADGLLLVNEDPSIVKSYPKVILTPNRIELQRLASSLGIRSHDIQVKDLNFEEVTSIVRSCSLKLGVTILAKGQVDIISDSKGDIMLTDEQIGSNRRCGGQGDITAGLIATYAHWIETSSIAKEIVGTSVNHCDDDDDDDDGDGSKLNSEIRQDDRGELRCLDKPYSWAAYLGAITTRHSNELAYRVRKNGMLASDMIDNIQAALSLLLDEQASNSSSGSITKPECTSPGHTQVIRNAHYAGQMSADQISRYARQMIMDEFGPERQMKLTGASALIIGAGGLGCPASIYMAAAGFGRIGLVDDDRVEVSNLHRQILHNIHKIGCLKTESIRRSLLDVNPNICIDTYSYRLNNRNAVDLFEDYDIIIDATDNLQSRYLISDAAVVARRPLISGAALRMCGQLTVYNYDDDTPCFRCLFPEPPPPNAVGSCSENGVLGVLPGIVGVLQALEAIKLASGLRPSYAGKMLTFDGQLGQFRHITLSGRRPDCAACGRDSKLDRNLIDYDQFCQMTCDSSSSKQQQQNQQQQQQAILDPSERISVEDYRQIIESGRSHVLVDVRPKAHSDISRFANALQIPLAKIVGQEDEAWKLIRKELLKSNEVQREIYVVCRRGIASQRGVRAIKHLIAEAQESDSELADIKVQVKDIIGGMTSWSAKVDQNYLCL